MACCIASERLKRSSSAKKRPIMNDFPPDSTWRCGIAGEAAGGVRWTRVNAVGISAESVEPFFLV